MPPEYRNTGIRSYSHPSLLHGLARRGFALREFEHALARRTDPHEALDDTLPFGRPEGLSIERVDPAHAKQVRLFAEVSSSGFRPADKPLSDALWETTRRVVQHPRSHSYLEG